MVQVCVARAGSTQMLEIPADGDKFYLIEMSKELDISSTLIRSKTKRNEDLSPYMGEKELKYYIEKVLKRNRKHDKARNSCNIM